jgi:hypothetical protein
MNTAYNLFPDSASARKKEGEDRKPLPAGEKAQEDGEMSTEAVAMAYLMRGVHF